MTVVAVSATPPVRRPVPATRGAAAGGGTAAWIDAGAVVSVERPMLGGSVGIHLQTGNAPGDEARARREALQRLDRIAVWAARLTRFAPTSDLVRLNGAPGSRVPVRPTLAAVLDWGRAAQGLSDGIVDIALLDARLAAEGIGSWPTQSARPSAASRGWSIDRGSRGSDILRPAGLSFDLDGVAKGWLADRALSRLAAHRWVAVDVDGDIAIRVERDRRVRFGVADPRTSGCVLVELELAGPEAGGQRAFGLATSGTTIHRWTVDDQPSHHLIDPRTGRPARTDVIQATVLAGSAREAEAIAKSAVILGSEASLERLDRAGVYAAVLLTEGGDVLLTPSTARWLG